MTKPDFSAWEPVIGLEIHAQLNTRTKMFSPAPNHFGDEPNINIGVIDTGQPGTLALYNEEAGKKAIMFGCAVGAKVARYSTFDRKSYFYPDSPRNFQITQFYNPILSGGTVVADVEGKHMTFSIEHSHLEDDAGMLKHLSSCAGVDYNRAGVPLIEIVSDPCMYSPKQATAYAMAVRAILEYIDASDCNMEEGSFRMDVNVSVRLKGEKTLRNKTEVKNLNSFTHMELAIESEIVRQITAYTNAPDANINDVIPSATYRFDLEKKKTVLMRTKESASDYRYFHEPDIPPIITSDEEIEEIRSNMPELPHVRYERYINTLNLSDYSSTILINDKALSDYFEEALKTSQNAKAVCNWLTSEFVGRAKEKHIHITKIGIPADHLSALVNLIEKGDITGKTAKEIADLMFATPGKHPQDILDENPDFKPLSDEGAIENLVDSVLKENAQSIIDFRAGKDKAFNYLFGQVMKLCKGKASPPLLKELLKKKIDESP